MWRHRCWNLTSPESPRWVFLLSLLSHSMYLFIFPHFSSSSNFLLSLPVPSSKYTYHFHYFFLFISFPPLYQNFFCQKTFLTPSNSIFIPSIFSLFCPPPPFSSLSLSHFVFYLRCRETYYRTDERNERCWGQETYRCEKPKKHQLNQTKHDDKKGRKEIALAELNWTPILFSSLLVSIFLFFLLCISLVIFIF